LSRFYNFRENLGRILLIIARMVLFTNTNIFLGLLLWIQQFGGWSPLTLPCMTGAILNFLFFILWLLISALPNGVKLLVKVATGLVLFIYGTFLVLLALVARGILVFPGIFGVLSLLGAIGMFLEKAPHGTNRQ